MHSLSRDLNGSVFPLVAAAFVTVTAGGGADGVEADGLTIDRQGLSDQFSSIDFLVGGSGSLASTETATVSMTIQDSADGSTWADVVSDTTVATATDATNGERAAGHLGVDLTKCRRYVRCQVTVTMSASVTDTFAYGVIAALAGARDLPISDDYQP